MFVYVVVFVFFFFLMMRRPPVSTRTDTLFPYTTLFRSLHETVLRRVEAFVADLGMNRVAHGAPAFQRRMQAELFGRTHRAVEGDPGHHLGMGEMPATDRKSTRLNSSH